MTNKHGSAAVSLSEVRQAKAKAEESLSAEIRAVESPLYGVAMLKIAMELKKPGAGELEEILTGVLQRMNIPESEFRTYLEQNGGMLRTIAARKKY
ncbi:MAG: hypothetical protein ACJ790_16875 [Myxococcaceae bacterium]